VEPAWLVVDEFVAVVGLGERPLVWLCPLLAAGAAKPVHTPLVQLLVRVLPFFALSACLGEVAVGFGELLACLGELGPGLGVGVGGGVCALGRLGVRLRFGGFQLGDLSSQLERFCLGGVALLFGLGEYLGVGGVGERL
jgi:hypothetical protein